MIGVPGGPPPRGLDLPDAQRNTGVAYAANAEYQRERPVHVNLHLHQALIGDAGDAAYTTSEVFYGGDMPWVEASRTMAALWGRPIS